VHDRKGVKMCVSFYSISLEFKWKLYMKIV
jgi:hypothetical protein